MQRAADYVASRQYACVYVYSVDTIKEESE